MGQPAPSPRRYLVFETSSLLTLLINFTDSQHHSGEALDVLLQPTTGAAAPLVDQVIIPDHVFYELTGILPLSLPRMKALFASHADQPELLARDIDFYVAASPRGSGAVPNGAFIKDQVRTLIGFVARHPDALMETDIAQHYCRRLKADHAVFGAVGDMPKGDYQPSFGDAMKALGDAFNVDALRLHAGQLFMMGFFREDEYNDRMGREEAVTASKQRFMKIKDFADILGRREWISHDQRDRIKQSADRWKREAVKHARNDYEKDRLSDDASYLTVGFLRQFPELMLTYRSNGQKDPKIKIESQIAPKDELITRSLQPSKLLMEHYLFGGIIPKEAMGDVAQALGYDVPEGNSNSAWVLSHRLYEQGFFERRVTVQDLQHIYSHLEHRGYGSKLGILKEFVAHLPEAVQGHRQRLDEACKRPSVDTAVSGMTGTPYEKIFRLNLIHGGMDVQEFKALVTQSGGLPVEQPDGSHSSNSGDIAVRWGVEPDGSDTVIRVSQEGFVSREGRNHFRRHYPGAGELQHAGQGAQHVWRFTAKELLAICRKNEHYAGPKDPVHRIFDAMLYRASIRSASRLHEVATEVVGESRLLQLEKDFSNAYVRRWREMLPPYAEPFSSLHVNRRIERKNLGEISAAEASARLLDGGAGHEVWLVNHDSDLYPDTQGTLQFSSSLKRMHSDRKALLDDTEQKISDYSPKRLHFVRTDQFLDTVSALLNRRRPQEYEGLRMKNHIRDYHNGQWENRMHAASVRQMQGGHQR